MGGRVNPSFTATSTLQWGGASEVSIVPDHVAVWFALSTLSGRRPTKMTWTGCPGQSRKPSSLASAGWSSLAVAVKGSWSGGRDCCSCTVTQFENSDVSSVVVLVSVAVTTSSRARPPSVLLKPALLPETVTVAKSRYVSPSPEPEESHEPFLKNSTK